VRGEMQVYIGYDPDDGELAEKIAWKLDYRNNLIVLVQHQPGEEGLTHPFRIGSQVIFVVPKQATESCDVDEAAETIREKMKEVGMRMKRRNMLKLHFGLEKEEIKARKRGGKYKILVDYRNGFWVSKRSFVKADRAYVTEDAGEELGVSLLDNVPMLILRNAVNLNVDANGKIIGVVKHKIIAFPDNCKHSRFCRE